MGLNEVILVSIECLNCFYFNECIGEDTMASPRLGALHNPSQSVYKIVVDLCFMLGYIR